MDMAIDTADSMLVESSKKQSLFGLAVCCLHAVAKELKDMLTHTHKVYGHAAH